MERMATHDALTALASAPAPDNGSTALELLEQALEAGGERTGCMSIHGRLSVTFGRERLSQIFR